MAYKFNVKSKSFDSEKQIITGKEILEIAGCVPVDDFQLLLKIDDNTFEPIQLDETVDLSKPGTEKFKVHVLKEIKIHINAEVYELKENFVTPREIVKLAEAEPEKYYLKQLLDHKDGINYKNDMDYPIQISNGMKFITCLVGPATVS
jgi:hypothetical protein